MQQWYCRVDGVRYGPAPEPTVREWIRQGRIGPQTPVRDADAETWRLAGQVEVFAELFPAAPPLPQAPPDAAPPRPAADKLKRHRGPVILTLGILGLTCCLSCGIAAWTMANRDLKEMKAGTMDPAGEGQTRAGRTCGILSLFVGLAVAAAVVGVWLWYFGLIRRLASQL